MCRFRYTYMTDTITDKVIGENGAIAAPAKVEELDQVAGNAEDEIGDRIAGIRETEMLYGPESLLAVFGPMIVHICGTPRKFRVSGFDNAHIVL